MKNKKLKLWTVVNFLILGYGIYLRSIGPDGVIIFAYLLYFFTFPIGIIVQSIIYYLNIPIYYNEMYPILSDILIPWIIFTIFGYIQWFILIPQLLTYFKSNKEK